MPLLLASPVVPAGGEISPQYTGDGASISPPRTSSGRGLGIHYSTHRPAMGLHETRNDFGKPRYAGPCPRRGHRNHYYHFRRLAISQMTLDLSPVAFAADVLRTAEPYAVQRAEPIAAYRR